MPIVEPKPINQITYMLVRVETDADLEQIVGKIESIENDISVRTRLDVIGTKHQTPDDELTGTPVIYFP